MTQFSYRARTSDGTMTRGTLRAGGPERANTLLRTHGLAPIEVTPIAPGGSLFTRHVFGGGVSRKDLVLFCRQLASLIQAGVPVLQALTTMQQQVEKASFRDVIKDLTASVEGGQALSGALGHHPATFNPFFIGVIRTGEASGRLSHALEVLGAQVEQDYTFVQKIRAALIYPAFVVTVVIILSLIMLVFVLPQLTGLFVEAGVQLPWPTRLLIGVMTFLQRYWLLVIAIVIALAAVARSYVKTPEGRYLVSAYLLRLPGVRPLLQKLYLARLTSVLQTLFDSGVPILQSLQLAREAVGNKVYQKILDDTAKAVRDGASLSSVWQREPFIPPLLSTMIGVGEKSGNLGHAFAEASRFFQRDVEAILATITVLIEPILIVILGLGVGLIVAAVLLPIYNLVLVL